LKRRYLAVRVDSEYAFKEREIMDSIWRAVFQLFGEYGASKTGLSLMGFDESGRLLFLRCFHDALEMVRASVASVTAIKEFNVALHVVGVSGTLKALRKRVYSQ